MKNDSTRPILLAVLTSTALFLWPSEPTLSVALLVTPALLCIVWRGMVSGFSLQKRYLLRCIQCSYSAEGAGIRTGRIAMLMTAMLLTWTNGAFAQAFTITEDFSSGTYSGGTPIGVSAPSTTIGWVGDWIETEANGTTSGDYRINAGGYLTARDDDQSIYREINISQNSLSSAVLTFNYRRISLATEITGTESFVLEGSSTSSTSGYTTLFTFSDHDINDVSFHTATVSLPTSTRFLRIRGVFVAPLGNLSASEGIDIDNISIEGFAGTEFVAGTVFFDLDKDGVLDSGEGPMGGITVTAYNAAGTAIATDVTNSVGQYVLDIPTGTQVRLEYTNFPTGISPTVLGANSPTSVVFYTSPSTTANFGLAGGGAGCSPADPTVGITCQDIGPYNGTFGTNPAVVAFPYSSSGTTPSPTLLARHNQVGTTFGLAHDFLRNHVYVSAFYRRAAGFGPAGPGGIYRIGGTTAGSPVVTYATIPNAGTNPHDFSLSITDIWYDAPERVAPATTANIPHAGVNSLGDIEISKDNSTLYTVNLNDKHLYSLPANSATIPVPSGNITDLGDISSVNLSATGFNCPAADLRPFALGTKENGDLYIGCVCSSSPRAYILKYNNTPGSFTSVFDYSLNFSVSGTGPTPEVWSNVVNEGGSLTTPANTMQLMLTDLAFDAGDNLTMAFRNRGYDIGYDQGGNNAMDSPVLRAGSNGAGGWVLENNAVSNGVTGALPNDGRGPGGGYFYDIINVDNNASATGGLAQHPNQQIIIAVNDPVDIQSAGIFVNHQIANPTAGEQLRGYQVYDSGGSGGLFGKNSGLGDIEVFCTPILGLQVGNRLWIDSDNDGVQDPGENGVAGAVVELWVDTNNDGAADTKVAQTSTNSNGNYLFSYSGNPNSPVAENWTFFADLNRVLAYTAYQIRVPNMVTVSATTYSVTTTQNADGTTNLEPIDNNDSDATAAGVIAFTTGADGFNNHTLDAGYSNCTPPTLTGPGSVCVGSTITLTGSGTPNAVNPYVSSNTAIATVTSGGVVTGVSAGPATITYTDNNGCQATATVTVNALPTITPGTPTCDAGNTTYSVTVTTTNANTLTTTAGTVTGSAPNFTVSGIPVVTNIMLTATNTAVTPNCAQTANVTSPTCSGASCTMSATGLANISCYPNGTSSNTSDDQIIFSLNPTGTSLGATYTVSVSSGTVTPTSGTYGTARWFRLNAGSAGAGNVTITITDVSGNCSTMIALTDPGNCAYNCSGSNLLVNPSFEVDALNTTPPTGWTCSGAGALVAGNNMDEPDGTKYAFDNGAGTLCQDVTASAGQTFSMTFFSGSHNPDGNQVVTMRYLDSGGSTLGTPATHTISFDTDNFTPQILGGPYMLSLPAAPAGTVSVRVEVSNGGLDFAKVDNFCLTATTAVCALTPASLTLDGIGFGPGSAPLQETVTLNGGMSTLDENNVAGFYFSTNGLYSFCTEITQPILPLQNPYSHEFNGTTNGFSASAALRLSQVVQASGFDAATGFGAGNNTVANFVALQMAVWNALYDTDYSVSTGTFHATTDNNGAQATANAWLAIAQTISVPTKVVHNLHHASGQDLLSEGNAPSNVTVGVTQPTCAGAGAPNNGMLTIAGFTDERYQYSTGVTFSAGSATPASITIIPAGGVIANNLTNTSQNYTVRIYDAIDDNCYIDQVVSITACTCPSGIMISQLTPSCLGTMPQNDGTISLETVTNGTHYDISSLNAMTYDGTTAIASATAIGSLPMVIQTAVPNTGGSYIVRVFNGSDDCYTDEMVTVAPVNCNCGPIPCGSTTVIKN